MELHKYRTAGNVMNMHKCEVHVHTIALSQGYYNLLALQNPSLGNKENLSSHQGAPTSMQCTSLSAKAICLLFLFTSTSTAYVFISKP